MYNSHGRRERSNTVHAYTNNLHIRCVRLSGDVLQQSLSPPWHWSPRQVGQAIGLEERQQSVTSGLSHLDNPDSAG